MCVVVFGASYEWIGVWEIDLSIPDLSFQFVNFEIGAFRLLFLQYCIYF
jgi:hypothetical protein